MTKYKIGDKIKLSCALTQEQIKGTIVDFSGMYEHNGYLYVQFNGSAGVYIEHKSNIEIDIDYYIDKELNEEF